MRWHRLCVVGLIMITAIGTVISSVTSTSVVRPVPIDYILFGRAGGALLTLQWDSVFTSSLIQAGPWELAYWGIPDVLGVSGYVGWIVTAIVANSLIAVAVALVAERLLRAVAATWSVTLAVAVAALAATSGLLAKTFAAGHPAELVIPLLWLLSARLARRGNPMAAAAVLASTAGWELWGILGMPVLLLAPRIDARTIWRSAVGGIVVVAAAFGPFLLLAPFPMFEYAWSVQPNTLAHLLFPHRLTFPWPLRLLQGMLSLSAGAATAMLLRRRASAIWLVPLAACAVRLLFDPVLAGYYGIPAVLLLLVGSAFAAAQRALLPALACLISAIVLTAVPLTPVTMAIVVAVTALMVATESRGRGESSGRQIVRKRSLRPIGWTDHGGDRDR